MKETSHSFRFKHLLSMTTTHVDLYILSQSEETLNVFVL